MAADFDDVTDAANRCGSQLTAWGCADEHDFQKVSGGPCRYRELHQQFAIYDGGISRVPHR